MSAARKPLDGFAALVMLVPCMCWGLQQVAVKATAASMSPMLQTGADTLPVRASLQQLVTGLTFPPMPILLKSAPT